MGARAGGRGVGLGTVGAALAALLACAGAGRAAHPQAGVGETAAATLRDRNGGRVGEVELRQAPLGVIARVRLEGVPAGEHGFHVHEVGSCVPPFESAGGHYALEGRAHGIENPEGMHAGDLPNVRVPPSGPLEITLFLERLSLRGQSPLLDADGSAFVVHDRPDDYRTDPTGEAGGRIACGVIEQR